MPCGARYGSYMADQGRQRLFFALWPDEEVRGQLAIYPPRLRGCGGRVVAVDNLHITLAFLGSVDEATRCCLEEAADAIQLPPFTLELDQLGFWRRPHVVWLGAEKTPESLLDLAELLKKAMIGCDLEPDERPFQAHMTLMRKARRPPAAEDPVQPFSWHIRDFALVLSETLPEGVRYRVLRRWGLK